MKAAAWLVRPSTFFLYATPFGTIPACNIPCGTKGKCEPAGTRHRRPEEAAAGWDAKTKECEGSAGVERGMGGVTHYERASPLGQVSYSAAQLFCHIPTASQPRAGWLGRSLYSLAY